MEFGRIRRRIWRRFIGRRRRDRQLVVRYMMHCPKCVKSSLKPRTIKNTKTVVDTCSICKGVWFDANELNDVLPVASKELNPPNDSQKTGMTCPRCRVQLMAFNYPQTYVKVDMCGECKGLWLNPSEFREIKIIRQNLKKKGKLETYAPPVGVKGYLLDWINSAIERLGDFD